MKVDLIYQGIPDLDGYDNRRHDEIEGVMIHRVGIDRLTGVDFGPTAEDICQAFTEGPAARYTGYKVPYSFIIQKDARIAQALPLGKVGPHARRLSRSFVSVAFMGDFRELTDDQGVLLAHEPTEGQFCAGVFLLRALLGVLAKPVSAIYGHTDPEMILGGSTKDRNKKCPGKGLDLYKLKSAVSGGLAL